MNINVNINWAIVLTLIFVVLQLTEVIQWSWWWVLSPLWISALLAVLIFGLVVLYFAIAKLTRRRYW